MNIMLHVAKVGGQTNKILSNVEPKCIVHTQYIWKSTFNKSRVLLVENGGDQTNKILSNVECDFVLFVWPGLKWHMIIWIRKHRH